MISADRSGAQPAKGTIRAFAGCGFIYSSFSVAYDSRCAVIPAASSTIAACAHNHSSTTATTQ